MREWPIRVLGPGRGARIGGGYLVLTDGNAIPLAELRALEGRFRDPIPFHADHGDYRRIPLGRVLWLAWDAATQSVNGVLRVTGPAIAEQLTRAYIDGSLLAEGLSVQMTVAGAWPVVTRILSIESVDLGHGTPRAGGCFLPVAELEDARDRAELWRDLRAIQNAVLR